MATREPDFTPTASDEPVYDTGLDEFELLWAKHKTAILAGGVGLGLLHADTALDARANGELVLVGEEQRKVPVYFSVRAVRQEEPLIAALLEKIKQLVD